MKNTKETLLLAKEIGLQEDLLSPTGEGLKAEVKRIAKDINGVGKKLSQHIEHDLENNRIIDFCKDELFLVESRVSILEKEMKDNISQRTLKRFWEYVKNSWKFAKPILYLAGVGMIYFLAKALNLNINM